MDLGKTRSRKSDVALPDFVRATERTQWVSSKDKLLSASITTVKRVRTAFATIAHLSKAVKVTTLTAPVPDSLVIENERLTAENNTLAAYNRVLTKSNEAYASSYVPEEGLDLQTAEVLVRN